MSGVCPWEVNYANVNTNGFALWEVEVAGAKTPGPGPWEHCLKGPGVNLGPCLNVSKSVTV